MLVGRNLVAEPQVFISRCGFDDIAALFTDGSEHDLPGSYNSRQFFLYTRHGKLIDAFCHICAVGIIVEIEHRTDTLSVEQLPRT